LGAGGQGARECEGEEQEEGREASDRTHRYPFKARDKDTSLY
jgi:hypothetical protein